MKTWVRDGDRGSGKWEGQMSDGERARQNDDTTYHESATLSDINITSIVQSETGEI